MCLKKEPDAELFGSAVDSVDTDLEATPLDQTPMMGDTTGIHRMRESTRVVLRSGAQGQFLERVRESPARAAGNYTPGKVPMNKI